MPILFMDGFDHYDSADILKKWSASSFGNPAAGNLNPGVHSIYACPPGGQGLKMENGACVSKYFGSPYTVGIQGVNIKTGTPVNAGTILMWLESDNNEQCSVRVDGSGRLLFTRAGTVLATSTNMLQANTWYHIEAKVTIHNTTGQYEVRVNGSSTGWIPPSTANQNTRARTNNAFYGVLLQSWYPFEYFDDYFCLDCSNPALPNSDFLGPVKILTLYPEAPGNYSQWSPNYLTNFGNVRERVGDGDMTFNYSNTPNQIDTFKMTQLPNAVVKGLQHVLMARQDSGSGRQIAPLQRSGTTDYPGTNKALTASYLFYLDVDDVDPATLAAYTYSNINASEFGYKEIT